MGVPAARLSDRTAHGGFILTGFGTVLIGGMPAARLSDTHLCPNINPDTSPHLGGAVTSGCPTVLIGGMPAARIGDRATCTGPVDTITSGFATVQISEQGLPPEPESEDDQPPEPDDPDDTEREKIEKEIRRIDAQIRRLEERARNARQLANDADEVTCMPTRHPAAGQRELTWWEEIQDTMAQAGSGMDPYGDAACMGAEAARDNFNNDADEYDQEAEGLRGRRETLSRRLESE
jgi:uncharacterized Zn-binding protein involved in type VI secretion